VGVNVLGPLSLEGDASVRIAPRDRVVLAALAMRPHEAVSADRLADAIWGDSPPVTWQKVVQGCVVRIRKLLGPESVATTDRGYVLTLPDGDIDAVRFEQLVRRGEELLALGEPERAQFTLTRALDLWRGTAFTDLEHWEPGAAAGSRLAELHHDAEELRLEAALRAGSWREVLPEAAALVTTHPLREARWGLLARAQYQAGRQGEALATLKRARTVLVGELGLDPGPDLVAVEQAILHQDPSLLPGPDGGASPVCPYPGLLAYGIDQAEDYFGRDDDIEACRAILDREGVLAVVGPSGSGKSSLVRAGVAAAARRDGTTVAVITPGAHPAAALAETHVLGTPAMLVVDQAEEVVTVCSNADERGAFLDAVVGHAASGAPVVLALRADRLGELTGHAGLARVLERGLHLLGAMSEPDLRSAVEGPARRAGLLLEPGLVDLLVEEVSGEPGALPLLSHALTQTWENREGRTLTVDGYRAAGGIRGAVARTAEAVYQGLAPEQQQGLRELLLRLVTSAPDEHASRSPVPRRAIATGSALESLVEVLVTARLMTSDGDVVELAHESLVGAWPRLRSWLDEDVEGQRILRHLTVASDSWEAMGRPDSELYRGTRLDRALEWRRLAGAELTPTEGAFLDAGRVLAEEEARSAAERLAQQRRANRRLRLLLGGVAAVLVVALAAGAVALRESRRADAQAAVAQVRELSAAARAASDTDPQLAILLALEAASLSEGGTDAPAREALEALHTAVLSSRVDLVVPELGGSVAWSPDGELFVGEGPEDSGVVDIRDADTGASVRSFVGHEVDVNDVAFGPDGLLATTGDDGALRVWDLDDGRLVTEVVGTGEVWGPSFDGGSGRLAASWTDEGVVRVVDARTGTELADMVVTRGVARTSLSPDGRKVAVVAFGDSQARVMDVRTGRVDTTITDHDEPVSAAIYSPDGRWLATASLDATVRIRDSRTAETLHVVDDLPTGLGSLAWTSDSGRIAVGAADGTTYVLDVTAKATEPAFVLAGGATTGIVSVAFSPDGSRLLSGQENVAAATVWDLGIGGDAEVANLPSNPSTWGGAAFTPDGYVATTTGGGSVTVWDLTDQRVVQRLEPEERGASPDDVRSVAVSPDGALLAAGSGERGHVWDLTTGEWLFRHAPGGWVSRPSFSPDGSRVAFSNGSGVAILGTDGSAVAFHPANADGELRNPVFTPDATTVSAVLVREATGLPDGRLLVWAPESDEDDSWQVSAVEPHAYSPDGTRVATSTFQASVEIHDTTSREHLLTLGGHTAYISDVVYSPDGALVATSDSAGNAILHDSRTGATVLRLPRIDGEVTSMAFSPDGRRLATASMPDAVVRVWALDPVELVAIARDKVNRSLTPEECGQYLHASDCP
jgi:WD40 repeat protein/DNA-binding SARP family transcriptional activator/energy-coupling factor transporter ATP-binding protein EcfA2